MKTLRSLSILAFLAVTGIAQTTSFNDAVWRGSNNGAIGPTGSGGVGVAGGVCVGCTLPLVGGSQNQWLMSGTATLTPFSDSATGVPVLCGVIGGCWPAGGDSRKDDGKGPTLQQVKLSAKVLTPASLAPAEYLDLAKHIGLDPSASTDEAEILEAIQHGGFHVFDFDKVDGYLWRQALREKSPSKWVWKSMRRTDWEGLVRDADQRTATAAGTLSTDQYARALPMRIMKDVQAILDCFPDAKFLVSDYEVIRPDPFLAVTTPRLFAAGKIWIIDCWDEPGFTEK